MRITTRIGTISLLAILLVCSGVIAEFDTSEYDNCQWLPGRLIIEFDEVYGEMNFTEVDGVIQFQDDNPMLLAVNTLNRDYNVHTCWNILQGLILKPELNPPDLSRVFVFRFNPSADVLEVCAAYCALPGIRSAEPDIMRPVDFTPNDPLFGNQWALEKIGAEQAWDVARSNSDMMICCVDQGVDWDHVDLINNIWVNPGEDLDGDRWIGWAFPGVVGDVDDINNLDDDQNGLIDDFYGWDFVAGVSQPAASGEDPNIPDNDPSEYVGYPHGTHCTGLAVATTNNNIGIAAINWHATILPVRAGYVAQGPPMQGYILNSASVPAIYYAVNSGADIISMSYGSGGQNPQERDALEYAWDSGLALYAAAGNDNNQVLHYPACYENVMAVAATDRDDQKTSYSSYGTWVDISSPGGDYNPGLLSTIPNNAYANYSGTSMASPQCAGCAGLLWSVFPNETNSWVNQTLMDYSYDIDPLNPAYVGLLGAGRVDMILVFSQFFPRLTIPSDPLVDDASGNGDGRPDWGETVNLTISLRNDGDWQNATNVEAFLRCPGENRLTITDSTADYGYIAAGFEASNTSDPLTFQVTPTSQRAFYADFELYITADNNGFETTLYFQLRIGRPEVLLVIDDGSDNYGSYYIHDLEYMDVEYDPWDVAELTAVPADELNRYEYVVWICGDENSNTLTATDRTNLSNFLDNGNRLMLVGQSIDEDIQGTTFYSDYLHAQHAEGVGCIQVNGVGGDPITDGMSLLLGGGSGGGNGNDSPSKINPVGGSSVIWTYEGGGNCGVRYDSGTWKTVYLSFALEAANHEGLGGTTERWYVISKTLQWLGLPVSVPGSETLTIPSSFALEGNYPNPFNPNTNIAFLLPNMSKVSVKVYNILGQEVATALDGQTMSAGRHVVTFDGTDLSSGIYFYQVTAGDDIATGKMVLMK